MLYTINDLPKEIRPRERLAKSGANSLADYELLAIILRTGTKNMSVLDLSKYLLSLYNLGKLNDITIEELKKIGGIKDAKAIEIIASIEFGKRVFSYNEKKRSIKDIYSAYDYVRYDLENLTHEEVHVLYLNVRGELVESIVITKGNVLSSYCDNREIVKWALKLSCYHIYIIHNHPTGNPNPSEGDVVFTRNIIAYCENLEIKVLDHLIIGKNSFYSFAKNQLFYR